MKYLRSKSQLMLAALLCLSGGAACGARQDRPTSAVDDADSWTRRSIWTEKKGEKLVIRVVGRASHASLDEAMAFDNAAQDAREQIAIYLSPRVSAFRERMRKLEAIDTAGTETDGEKQGGATKTETDLSSGRTLAEASAAGLEIITSKLNSDTNTLLVLGELDADRARQLMMKQSDVLDAQERERIQEDSGQVKQAWEDALASAEPSKD